MSNKLVYVGFGFLHHLGGHAGYHQIKNALDYDYYVDAQSYHNKYAKPSRFKLQNWLRAVVFPHFCFGFTAFPWFLFQCMWMALTKGSLTFHFIYGENLYYDFRLLKTRGCKTVVTLHQPYEWFANKPSWRRRLKSVDHIILVGGAEVSMFKELTGRNNVTYIPHGICSDFYCPDASVHTEKMVLTVGNWLRDFILADKVYQQLLASDSEIRIVIVSNPQNKKYITPNERISFFSGITDEELRILYRKTSCLFLPLTRYTANNALLEAGAVGCPILIACDNPDNCYIPEDMITLLPAKTETVLQAIANLMQSKSSASRLSMYVDNYFSWSKIAAITKDKLYSI